MRRRHGPPGDSGGPHTRPPRSEALPLIGPPRSEALRGGRGFQRPLLAATLACALLLASACEAGVGVDIDVAENGSGTVAVGVSLDRAAADALGDLVNQIDLADLALAGWDVAGPAREADNLLWVRATKPFGSAEELPSVLTEVAGPDVFGGFELRRRAEFAEQTWEIVGQVDPAAAFPELLESLASNPGLEQRVRGAAGAVGGSGLGSGLTMSLNIRLPGDLRSGGESYGWTALSADSPPPPTQVSLLASEVNTTARTLRLVGLAAAALFILALLLNLLSWWYVSRHRTRRELALLARADSEQPVDAGAPAAGAAGTGPVGAGAVGAGAPRPGEFASGLGPPGGAGSAGGAGEFARGLGPPSTGAAIGDDIDWAELESAEYESLATDLPDLPADLDVTGAEASADDWTASLEEPPPAAAATQAAAHSPAAPEAPEEPEAPEPEPELPAAPEAPTEPEPEPPAADRAATEPLALEIPFGPTATLAGTDEATRTDEIDSAEAEDAEPERADGAKDAETDTAEPERADGAEGAEPDTAADEPAQPDAAEPEGAEADGAEGDEPDSAADEPAEPEGTQPEGTQPEGADETEDTEPEGAEPDSAAEPADAGRTAPSAPPASRPGRSLRLVVIGGWGVLFQPADPAGDLLIPFVRQSGSAAPPAAIREAYRLATLGRLTPEQLWEACGLTGEPTWTHGPYTGRMTVSEGAAGFVRSLLRRDIAVGCVTDDVSEWSWRLRAWTGFEAVTPWVVSGDIGIRKPDPGVFEMLRRASGVPFANCLVIDNDPRTLDAARSLGMSTALFGAEAPAQPSATGHPAVGDFTALLRRP